MPLKPEMMHKGSFFYFFYFYGIETEIKVQVLGNTNINFMPYLENNQNPHRYTWFICDFSTLNHIYQRKIPQQKAKKYIYIFGKKLHFSVSHGQYGFFQLKSINSFVQLFWCSIYI